MHGDDFTCVGPSDALTWCEQKLKDSFEIKGAWAHGEAPHLGKEMRILNRVVRLDPGVLLFEADPGTRKL